ncbi:uncharacterized protein LOC144263550 isoform X2 [Eretmochelys imbricata]
MAIEFLVALPDGQEVIPFLEFVSTYWGIDALRSIHLGVYLVGLSSIALLSTPVTGMRSIRNGRNILSLWQKEGGKIGKEVKRQHRERRRQGGRGSSSSRLTMVKTPR